MMLNGSKRLAEVPEIYERSNCENGKTKLRAPHRNIHKTKSFDIGMVNFYITEFLLSSTGNVLKCLIWIA